jgi:glycosyltransferase involved in cell wall biosynthesis
MNIPSHYQAAFFSALADRNDIDLQVRYLRGVSKRRVAEGWHDVFECQPYEQFAREGESPGELLKSLSDWKDRIHILSSHFNSELIDYFCANQTCWCHWSEMPGVRLAELVRYHMGIFKLLNPLMFMLKRGEGLRIRDHALGAFGQGVLAERAFRLMGVPSSKISSLFYTPEPLSAPSPCEKIVQFAGDRKVFLSVGALCKRKGVDILLKAFARLGTSDWCLVLCGLDKADGLYQALAEKLGIQDRVLFLGVYPASRIAEVYAAADVFVLSSRFDGWGAVLNEAASVGLPLIGTDLCGASWHVLRHAETGFRVKAGSVGSLRKAMRRYVEHPHLTKSHGLHSSAVFSSELTPERNAERLVRALETWGAQ